MKRLLLLLATLAILLSCENARYSESANMSESAAKESSTGQAELKSTNTPADRKIIWKGDIELQVKNVDQTTDDINKLCSKYGAFVSNMNMTSDNYQISNRISIRVESMHFNKLINSIKGKAEHIRRVEISSNDVTEEYIDIESRLRTKKEVRERYISILKNKTGKISEVIEAEEAIRKITEEIEAKEARLRFLNDKVKFSTINIHIFQKVNYKPEPSVFEKSYLDKATEALKNGWSIVTSFLLVLINIWPLVLIAILIVWKRKWIRRKFKKEPKI